LPIQSNEEEFFSDKNKKIEIKVKQKMQWMNSKCYDYENNLKNTNYELS
jgi:hypothetical protein